MHSTFSLKANHKKTGRSILRPVLLSAAAFLLFAGYAFGAISDDLLKKGREKMRDKDYAGAIAYFESAHKVDLYNKNIHKNLSAAYNNLAVLHAEKGELENAIRNGLQALRFDPDNSAIKEQVAVFYNNLALRSIDSGKHKNAKEAMEKALEYSPDSGALKKNLYNVLLQYADYQHARKNDPVAIKLTRQAIDIAPDVAEGYVFLGNIYYKQDQFTEALKHWQKALLLSPENENLKTRIEALKREKVVERDFGTERKSFFRIRFDREMDSRYVGIILDILDDARRSLRSGFGFYSDEIIPVIVYDDSQFKQATAQPHWTQGLYDGKIRIRYQDVSRDDANLRRVLFHEYAHAMIFMHLGSNIPLWLNEGFAQFNEPDTKFTASDKIFLSGYAKRQKGFSLEGLDAMFAEKDDQETVRAAYLEARLFFDYLIDRYTKYRMKRFFEGLKQGKPWQKAFTETYQVSIDRIEKNFNNYLDDLLK
jgi:tetratricopeptide (TPR) repeat protein